MASTQKMFNPINFGFEFGSTPEGWYTFDSNAGHRAALKARNAFAKEQKALGHKVVNFSLPNQLITRGGIGTGNPQIEVLVNVYGCNVYP